MTFNDPTLLLPSKFMKNWTQILTDFAKNYLAALLRYKHHMVLTIPFRMGQTLTQFRHAFSCYGFTSSSYRGSYFTVSSLKAFQVALVKPVASLKYTVMTHTDQLAFGACTQMLHASLQHLMNCRTNISLRQSRR